MIGRLCGRCRLTDAFPPKKHERMPVKMNCTLQRAGIWKRISAYLLDLILLAILATGALAGLSAVFGYDEKMNRVTQFYQEYEAAYGIDFDITEEEYLKLPEETKAAYDTANQAMNRDEEMLYAYNLLFNISMIMVTLGILLAYLILEFLIPLFFGNGQTVGKKIFGIGLMRSNFTRLKNPVLFVRAILGKYTIETMIPVFLILMSVFGTMGAVGGLAAILIPVINVITMSATRTNSALHDMLADTVAVDLASQLIFETEAERIEYQKKLHAEEVARATY